MYDIESLDIVPLFEQYNNRTLIIVDVQEPFRKWWDKNGKYDLPERINDYCADFPEVYQIWDDHYTKSPSWKFYNETAKLKKHYGTDTPTGDIKDYTSVFNPNDIKEAMEIAKPGEIAMPKIFNTKDGNYVIRVIGGNHKWFFVSKEMYDVLSHISNDIVLVGGAEGECLKDVQVLLDILGKTYRNEERYCYNAKDKNDDYFKDDDTETDDSEEENPGSKEIPMQSAE